MNGTNVPMKYICETLIYFCFHVKYDHLALGTYLGEEAAKVWCVCPSQHMNKFERLLFMYLFNLEYLKDYNDGGAELYLQKKEIFFNPCISQIFGSRLAFHRVT